MARFIQYMTGASLFDGAFDNDSGWSAAGMGYVIVTENGRLIVVDGGFVEDACDLVQYLKGLTSEKIPVVDYWIITHAHLDHYGAIKEISENADLKNRVKVCNFIYMFPEEFCDKLGKPKACAYDIHQMENICSRMNALKITPERGMKLSLDDIEIEFLYVPDDCSILNTAGGNPNFCSLIFAVAGNSKKAMITGDAYGRSMQMTAWRYAKKLKCDILQMPHHALCDAYSVDFYKCVAPSILFMPISKAGYRAMHSDLYSYSEGYKANLDLENKADKVFKAFEGTVEVLI